MLVHLFTVIIVDVVDLKRIDAAFTGVYFYYYRWSITRLYPNNTVDNDDDERKREK